MAEPPTIVDLESWETRMHFFFATSQHFISAIGFVYLLRAVNGEINPQRHMIEGREFSMSPAEAWCIKNMGSLLVYPIIIILSPTCQGRFVTLLLFVDTVMAYCWIPGQLNQTVSGWFHFREISLRFHRNFLIVLNFSLYNLYFAEEVDYTWMRLFNVVVSIFFFFYGMKKKMANFPNIITFVYNGRKHIPSYEDYEHNTSPMHFGEVIQWISFHVICNSPVSLGYAVYKIELAWARAYMRHRWFRRNVPNYPRRRAMLIPHLF
ncbi:hypothetical protein B9Z55_024848 [Caenorhabditis nigoni]|uniref:3-oxo-5-alpha-steroid 4-dehydrogenase C-terminal domain-containing protein n=1 Tax=Caenorhabditis nigoni TaxID=1611254 RepID=A0A2G5SW75_9PELO|nr:hypothetical protein B9Z55_024848 [Caenorhabditis nigoni]